MDESVSIVVPVRNAQATLPAQIANLLDVMSDMAPHFEIIIVDDASIDETEDVAVELARLFPQVRVAYHGLQPGAATAVMTGLAAAEGDLVFVLDAPTGVSVSSLRQLWQLRDDQQLVMAHADQPEHRHERGVIRRLMAWGEALKACSVSSQGTVQMIRRSAARQMGTATDRKLMIDHGTGAAATGILPAPTVVRSVDSAATS